jgi:orotate phosphoribosyltransferase
MPDTPSVSVSVARALLAIGAIGFTPDQPVTFKSGLRSPVYVDNRKLIFHPLDWRVIIDGFASCIASDDMPAEVIAGVETAGIPHSSALAFATGKPSVFVRKTEKDHGLKNRIEGGEVKGMRVVLIEDMVTTGESSLSAVAALRESGAVVIGCLSIVSYGFKSAQERFGAAGVVLHTLTTFPVILDEAVTLGRCTSEVANTVRSWLADPYKWNT